MDIQFFPLVSHPNAHLKLRLPIPDYPFWAGYLSVTWKRLALNRDLDRNTARENLYEILKKYVLCDRSPETHVGPDEHAVDLLVPDGTPIVACAAGKVVAVKQDGRLYGPPGSSDEIRSALNYVTLLHPPTAEYPSGFFTQYCHVAWGSPRMLRIHEGSEVEEGEKIGIVGKNGWTTGDHLHVMAYHFPNGDGVHQSVPIQWK